MISLDRNEILARLVGFESISRTSNIELIDFIRNYLDGFGIESMLAHNRERDRVNLYATIGPDDVGGVMLSGHTDVVPVNGQSWSRDPFRLDSADDGLLYGRGSCDMKGFIACVLAQVPEMVEKRLHVPVHMAFSCDEEIGCVGVRDLVSKLKQFEVTPRLGVIGEPTGMHSVIAHKGKRAFRVTITGSPSHSAFIDDGVNAVEYAAALVVFIQQMNRRMIERGRTDSGYQVDHSSFHTGVIQGGEVLNIVPSLCRFDFEIRHLPEDDIETIVSEIQEYAQNDLLPKMRHCHSACEITFEALSAYPGLDGHAESDCARLVESINYSPSPPGKISFGTEAGIFQQELGIDCVVCGPGHIAQAHKPDEYVSRAQLQQCDGFIKALIGTCRRGDNQESC